MLSLSDPRWATLKGGYRVQYDASPALSKLQNDFEDPSAWKELWQELHHQADVDEASYASVPVLVSLAARTSTRTWQLYALACAIESERHRRGNPPVPSWLASDYVTAWQQLAVLALSDLGRARDPLVIRSALATVALARGARQLGSVLASIDDAEVQDLAEQHLAWSEHYAESAEPPL